MTADDRKILAETLGEVLTADELEYSAFAASPEDASALEVSAESAFVGMLLVLPLIGLNMLAATPAPNTHEPSRELYADLGRTARELFGEERSNIVRRTAFTLVHKKLGGSRV